MPVNNSLNRAECLVYCPMPYNGRGPSRSCIEIVEHFSSEFDRSQVFLPKHRMLPDAIHAVSSTPGMLRHIPWRFSRSFALSKLDKNYARALDRASIDSSVAYFWPSPTPRILKRARDLGIASVREMINSYTGTAKAILDQAYMMAGMHPGHAITEERAQREKEELAQYDYVFSSNDEVDASLLSAGVPQARILKTSFGWNPRRFDRLSVAAKSPVFTVIFVGMIGVRKGVLQLLDAWKLANIPGRLLLVGNTDTEFEPLLSRFQAQESIKVIPFTNDIEALYKSSHVFVFPTFEEGGPQVTYEAAGCGLPAVTTPMGAGRIIKHESNGLIVAPGDVPSLAAAIVRLFEDEALRAGLAERARLDAHRFTYDVVGRERATMLREALRSKR